VIKIFRLLFLSSLLLLISCDSVGHFLGLKKDPELGGEGIVVSADRVAPRDTVTAYINATNPIDGPMYFEWTATGGGYIPPADGDTVQWIAPLIGGTYRLQVKVRNNDGSAEAYKDIVVISADEPLARIEQPRENSYFVSGETVYVTNTAEHENGIATVRMFVNQKLVSEVDGHAAGAYRFNFTADTSMVGDAVIKVEAQAANQFSTVGADSVTVHIKGYIEGENGF